MSGATSFVLLSLLLCLVADSRRTIVIDTSHGPVRGLILQTVENQVAYSSFKGIPYAQPPLGELRFKPPVPIRPWRKVLNAFQEGSMCPQQDLITEQFLGKEDCLYLNVFTPETKFTKGSRQRPVMVWIYGGGYQSGYSNTSLYGPDFFIEEDLVFVSFNYRLGVLGFLTLKHPNATGNAGLKDQNLVLQWVQRNIAAFGGDPKQLTIFGESAGGSSVGFHALSERSRGLFQRSIGMSGTPLCPWAFHTPESIIRNAHHIAASLNFVPKNKNDLLEFLRQAPAMDLVKAGSKINLDFLPFRPTIEDPEIDPDNSTFLSECPITQYSTGNFYRHPMMLGYTHDEVILFLGPPIGIANMIDWAKKYIDRTMETRGHMNAEPKDQMALLVERLYNTTYEKGVKIGTDIFFTAPIDLTQRLLALNNAHYPIYYYRLSYQTQQSMHKMLDNPLNGTAHFDDIGYIFHVQNLTVSNDQNDPLHQFRKKMVRLWANFAKYGDPTPKHLKSPYYNVLWTDSGVDGLQFDINTADAMYNRLVDEIVKKYENLLYAKLPLASSCIKTILPRTDIL